MYSETLTDLVKRAYEALHEYLNLPTLESLQNIDWSDIRSAIATIGMTLILIVFSAFALWLIRAIGLYKMAKNKNDKLAFFSFVPYGATFVMGRVVGKTKLFGIEIDYPEWLLTVLIITMLIQASGAMASILFVFFYYGVLYKLYKLKWRGFAAVATILSLFVPVLQPIFLFLIRNM